MSGPFGSDGGRKPELRVSEKERDDAAARLAKFCSEGRVTLEEFSERVEVVLAARTQGDLDKVMSDLPAGEVAPYESRLPASGSVTAVMSSTSKRGRWRPMQRLRAIAIMGNIDLDLRNAEIGSPELTIHAWALMGSIRVTVPEGVAVHLSGVNIMGDKRQRTSDVPLLPGSPLIKVRAVPIMGSIEVRTRRSRPKVGKDIRSAVEARVREHVAGRLQEVGRPGPHGGPPCQARRAEHRRPGGPGTRSADPRAAVPAPVRLAGGHRGGAGRAQPPPAGTVTIQFCDVSGFTEMTERLGDLECQRLSATYFQIVREQVDADGGYEVKCHADEAMIAFSGAGQAVRCAIDIQRALGRYNGEHEDRPIRAHIGLHTGEAIQDGGDFLGRTVILASRITDEAAADEILVSSVLRELATGSADLEFGESRTVTLQGLSETQRLFPVVWS